MAPARKKGGSSSRSRKLAAFLKDFDREVSRRLERLRADGECLVKEIENLYDMAILRLPLELRQMNWLEYYGAECRGLLDLEIAEIDKLTAGVINAPFDIVKKGEFKVGLVRWKHVVNINSVLAHIPQNVKARKIILILPLVSAVPLINFIKTFKVIQSSALFITPATGRMVDICARGGTSMITPRFDSRVFKTPGLRTPALNERVYTISANGSPLADSGDAVLTLPLGGGESIRLTAKDLTKKNFLQLNPKARGLMKKLSVSLGVFVSQDLKL
uniref:Borealin n=1 Tax=Catharus ustulatus TaxID=91951 RepID=A0A8C3U602_CATUS